jgi:hypothetical protein
MATKEDQETLRQFVQHVARAFYDPKYIVVMDQLARHPVYDPPRPVRLRQALSLPFEFKG